MSLIAVIVILSLLALIIFLISRSGKNQSSVSDHIILRCPNCGSPVQVKGSHWECGYCGNSGMKK